MTVTGLEEVVAEAVAAHHVPGMVAGVWSGGEATVVAHGVASVETEAPLRPDTLFQIGSVSKTFTSALVGLLVAEGRVSYDDPVARHLPDLAAALAPAVDLEAVTVEHLLSHQVGFDGDHLFTHPGATLADLGAATPLFAPGEGHSYNNAAFSLAGALVAAVEGEAFVDVLGRRLLGPLGMRTACVSADEAITRPVALPHLVVGDEAAVLRRAGWQPGWELSELDQPAGGLVASVEHLLRWGRFQLDGRADDGATVLDDAARARLHTPVVEADQVAGAGLDWEVRVVDGVTTVGHGGLTVGYSTSFVVVPEREVVVACCTHATNGAAVNQAVRRWLLEEVAGLVWRDPEPDPDAVVDPAVLGRYLGSFGVLTVEATDAPGQVRVSSEVRDDLGWPRIVVDPPATFALTGPSDAVSIGGPGPARLLRFGDGWLHLGGRRAPKL